MSLVPPDAHLVDKFFDWSPNEFGNEYPVFAIQDNFIPFPVSPRRRINPHPMSHFLYGEPERVPFDAHLLTHRFGYWQIRVIPQELDNPRPQVEGNPMVAFFPMNNRALRDPKARGKLFQEKALHKALFLDVFAYRFRVKFKRLLNQ